MEQQKMFRPSLTTASMKRQSMTCVTTFTAHASLTWHSLIIATLKRQLLTCAIRLLLAHTPLTIASVKRQSLTCAILTLLMVHASVTWH